MRRLFGVDGLDDRGPAGGEFVDTALEQLPLGGAEALPGGTGVERGQRVEPLDVEEEQHAAEQDLGEQLVPAEGAPHDAVDQEAYQDAAEDEQSDDHSAEQSRVAADREVAQDLLVRGLVVLGEEIAEEGGAADPFEGDQAPGAGHQDLQGAGAGPRPEQERSEGRADDEEVEGADQGGRAAEEDPQSATGPGRCGRTGHGLVLTGAVPAGMRRRSVGRGAC